MVGKQYSDFLPNGELPAAQVRPVARSWGKPAYKTVRPAEVWATQSLQHAVHRRFLSAMGGAPGAGIQAVGKDSSPAKRQMIPVAGDTPTPLTWG
jgi:hypothetical protein